MLDKPDFQKGFDQLIVELNKINTNVEFFTVKPSKKSDKDIRSIRARQISSRFNEISGKKINAGNRYKGQNRSWQRFS